MIPSRLEQEKSEMLERYPDFSLPYYAPAPWYPQISVVVWTGIVHCPDGEGGILRSLGVNIHCLPNYPQSLPVVYDNPRTLTAEQCHHHMYSNGSLCYGDKRDERLRPDKISVATVVDFLVYFTGYLWCYEQGQDWPHEYLHRDIDILSREINREKIARGAECLCGMGKTYRCCHLGKVKDLIKKMTKVSVNVQYNDIWVPPNSSCPCKSGKEYKRCCKKKHDRENFFQAPLFMLLKYPELNWDKAEQIFRHFANRDDLYGELVRESRIAKYFTA